LLHCGWLDNAGRMLVTRHLEFSLFSFRNNKKLWHFVSIKSLAGTMT